MDDFENPAYSAGSINGVSTMSSDELTEIAGTAARGGLFLFAGNTASTVILAVGSIIIARLLGPSNYGLYVLTMVTPLLFVSVADAGMNSALVRISAKLRTEGDHYGTSRTIKLGFLLKLSISVVAFLICYFGAEPIAATILNRPELAPFLRLASVLIILQTVFDASSYSFIGLDLMHYSASMQILYSLLKSVLAPALILVGFGIAGAIGGYVLGVLVAAVTGATVLFTRHTRPAKEMSGSTTVGLSVMFGYGFPLYLSAILGVFLTQYQNIILAHFATNVEIGNFGAASNFNSFLSILSYPIITAMFPMFSKMDRVNQRNDLARAFELAVKYASLLLIPASVAVMVFSRDLVYLTYGRGYTLAPLYLILLSAVYLLTGVGYQILGSFLSGVAETRAVLEMSILTLGVYLPVGLAFTWLWGPYGLLAAGFLSTMTSTLYGAHVASLKCGARLDLKASARIILAALIAVVPPVGLLLLHVTGPGVVDLIIGGGLFLVVYLTLAPLLGAVGASDINNLDSTLSRTRIVAALLRPVLGYERRILSLIHQA